MGEGGAKKGKHNYQKNKVSYVNTDIVKKIFTEEEVTNQYRQFKDYTKNRKVMQWGGLSDQFDMYEKKHGITLELLKYFKKINYPLCFSTKSTWVFYDERYRELFKGQDNWNMKISIINLNAETSSVMEKGVASPMERLKAGREYTKLNNGGFTLRLRPFIIGLTDKDNEHLELIKLAAEHGATAVSTEFFCLEARADANLKARYKRMSEIIGFDIWDFYKKYSTGSGYKRLNYNLKTPYITQMKKLCDQIGLRFYVSDAHHKEKCANGSCCGLPNTWNYSRGQFTEALLIAREKGEVRFSDVNKDLETFKNIPYNRAVGFNTVSSVNRLKLANYTMYDYIRKQWNLPNSLRSPYKYFGGILTPTGLDENKDVIYKYNKPKDII